MCVQLRYFCTCSQLKWSIIRGAAEAPDGIHTLAARKKMAGISPSQFPAKSSFANWNVDMTLIYFSPRCIPDYFGELRILKFLLRWCVKILARLVRVSDVIRWGGVGNYYRMGRFLYYFGKYTAQRDNIHLARLHLPSSFNMPRKFGHKETQPPVHPLV